MRSLRVNLYLTCFKKFFPVYEACGNGQLKYRAFYSSLNPAGDFSLFGLINYGYRPLFLM